jgi:hypothetical protein
MRTRKSSSPEDASLELARIKMFFREVPSGLRHDKRVGRTAQDVYAALAAR